MKLSGAAFTASRACPRTSAAPCPRTQPASCRTQRKQLRGRGYYIQRAAVLPEVVLGPLADAAAEGLNVVSLATGALISAALGVAGLKSYCYSQLEYVTAAILTNQVPRSGNGAKVIQWGGGARQLYYYPKNTIQITNVGENVNKSLMEQAGVQAAVPTLARQQPIWDLSFAADGSVDAIVSLQSLAPLPADKRRAALSEAARVLRPGGVLVFVERAAADGSPRAPPASPLRGLLTLGAADGGAAMGADELEGLLRKGQVGVWEGAQWDYALEGQDPFALGVALRGQSSAPPSGLGKAGPKQEKQRQRKKPTSAKGF